MFPFSPHSSLKITLMYLCLHCILIFCIISHDSELSQLRGRSTVFDVKLFFSRSFVCLQIIQLQDCLFLLRSARRLGAGSSHGLVFCPEKSLILTKSAQSTQTFCLELRSLERENGGFVLFQVKQKQ